ncbi:MAG: M13 family metallopeptidase [Casimicrobiaceae bacterium]
MLRIRARPMIAEVVAWLSLALVTSAMAETVGPVPLAIGPAVVRGVDGLGSKAEACTDFYTYANGAWLTSTEVPADRASWGVFNELDRRTKADLRDILESAARNPALRTGSNEAKVVAYYRSGMDTAAIERAGIGPLESELTHVDAIQSAQDVMDALARLHRVGIPAGFRFGIGVDAADSRRYIAEIYQGGLGLPDRDDYFRSDPKSETHRTEYVRHVAKMLELLGERDPDRTAAGAATVMRLEAVLARASMTNEQRRNPRATTNKRRVVDLASTTPGIDWVRYFRQVGVGTLVDLNVAQPAFVEQFAAMLSSVSPADWKVYLRWHTVHAVASKLSAAFETENFRFYGTTLTGRTAMLPREERVIDIISGRRGEEPLAMALGELYVAKRFPPGGKARALAVVEDVRSVLRDRIAELAWMSAPTREAAIAKLDRMVAKIGYPDAWRDYTTLRIVSPTFAGIWLAANAFETDRQFQLMQRPVDRQEWFSGPHVINAFYQPRMNAIVFPAGILQLPFFDPTRDAAMNYGGIGMVIGHEITHGFDDHGRQFDAFGNLNDWWTKDDAALYLARANLVAEQYGEYVGIDGLKVQGRLTLGENIADIGGLKIAYLALQRSLRQRPQGRDGLEGKIDGLSVDQRFFISFARIWRSKMRPELERLLINSDPHSPPRFRVRGAVANMPESGAAFACQADAATMRSEAERATIW